MPLKDVTVTIDLVKPPRLLGFGKPLIVGAAKTGASTIKNYAELSAVKVDFAETTNAYKKAAAIFAQDYAPTEISIATYDAASLDGVNSAADAVEKYFENDWYFVLTADAELVDQLAVADYVEAQKFKVYATKVGDGTDRNAFKQKAYDRTIVFHHTITNEEPDAALVGELGSQKVGSVTWKFKKLRGITPLDLTKTELNTIHADKAIAYVVKAGSPQTSEGTVVSGEYMMLFTEGLTQQILKTISKTRSLNPKSYRMTIEGLAC